MLWRSRSVRLVKSSYLYDRSGVYTASRRQRQQTHQNRIQRPIRWQQAFHPYFAIPALLHQVVQIAVRCNDRADAHRNRAVAADRGIALRR